MHVLAAAAVRSDNGPILTHDNNEILEKNRKVLVIQLNYTCSSQTLMKIRNRMDEKLADLKIEI